MPRSLFIILLASALFDDAGSGCSACDKGGGGGGNAPINADFSITQSKADAVLAAAQEQATAWAPVENALKKRDFGAENDALHKATQDFINAQAGVLGSTRGVDSDEQRLAVLTAALRYQINDAIDAAPAAEPELSAQLDAYIAASENLEHALGDATQDASRLTAAHEAAHVVQQETKVTLRSAQIVPVRGWIASGETAQAKASCTETLAILVDLVTGEALTTPDVNVDTTIASAGRTRSVGWSVTPLGTTGSCTLTLTSDTDLRSAPQLLAKGNATVDAFLASQTELAKSVTAAMAAKSNGFLLARLSALSASVGSEFVLAIKAGRPLALSDARLAAEARGAWVSAIIEQALAHAPAVAPQINALKVSHDMQMGAIRNLKG